MNTRFSYLYLFAASSFISMPLSAAAAPGVVEELKNCARIVERDARINCYESLGKRVLGEDASAPTASVSQQGAPAATTATAAVAPVTAVATSAETPASKTEMDEHMGGYKFEEKPSDHPDNTTYARVTLCQQDRDNVWFFKFENGQVWKQVDRTRLSFQGCDFPVAIVKDGFGYKMQIEGSERQIRISRRK